MRFPILLAESGSICFFFKCIEADVSLGIISNKEEVVALQAFSARFKTKSIKLSKICFRNMYRSESVQIASVLKSNHFFLKIVHFFNILQCLTYIFETWIGGEACLNRI